MTDMSINSSTITNGEFVASNKYNIENKNQKYFLKKDRKSVV